MLPGRSATMQPPSGVQSLLAIYLSVVYLLVQCLEQARSTPGMFLRGYSDRLLTIKAEFLQGQFLLMAAMSTICMIKKVTKEAIMYVFPGMGRKRRISLQLCRTIPLCIVAQ